MVNGLVGLTTFISLVVSCNGQLGSVLQNAVGQIFPSNVTSGLPAYQQGTIYMNGTATITINIGGGVIEATFETSGPCLTGGSGTPSVVAASGTAVDSSGKKYTIICGGSNIPTSLPIPDLPAIPAPTTVLMKGTAYVDAPNIKTVATFSASGPMYTVSASMPVAPFSIFGKAYDAANNVTYFMSCNGVVAVAP